VVSSYENTTRTFTFNKSFNNASANELVIKKKKGQHLYFQIMLDQKFVSMPMLRQKNYARVSCIVFFLFFITLNAM
jgi:hypothetical protein